MNIFICPKCGSVYKTDSTDKECPDCGIPAINSEIDDNTWYSISTDERKRYIEQIKVNNPISVSPEYIASSDKSSSFIKLSTLLEKNKVEDYSGIIHFVSLQKKYETKSSFMGDISIRESDFDSFLEDFRKWQGGEDINCFIYPNKDIFICPKCGSVFKSYFTDKECPDCGIPAINSEIDDKTWYSIPADERKRYIEEIKVNKQISVRPEYIASSDKSSPKPDQSNSQNVRGIKAKVNDIKTSLVERPVSKEGYDERNRVKTEVSKAKENDFIVYDLIGCRGRSMRVYRDRCIINTDVTVGSVLTNNATDGEKTIFYKDVIGIQYKKPKLTIGYIQLETASAQTNNLVSNQFSENTFTYEKYNELDDIMDEVKDYITYQVAQYKNL